MRAFIFSILTIGLVAPAALGQEFADSTDGDFYQHDPPRTLSPGLSADPLSGPPLAGETLPRAEADPNPYRQPDYTDYQLPPVEPARFEVTETEANSVASPRNPLTTEHEPRPLKQPGEAKKLPKPQSVDGNSESASGLPSMFTVFGSLLLVLGAFFAIAWVMRRGMPSRLTALPTEVVEVLGRSTLATRNQMHLIRVGNKLLLVSVTPTGAETLTEITDPLEVDRLGSICSQQESGGVAESFRGVLNQINREAETGGQIDLAADGEARHRPTPQNSTPQNSTQRQSTQRQSTLLSKLTRQEPHDA